jgi:hypothetical protein
VTVTRILPELSRLRLLEPGVELREREEMTRSEKEHGWVAAPEEM